MSAEQVRSLVVDAKAAIVSARGADEVRAALVRVGRAVFREREGADGETALAASARVFFDEQYANWTRFLLQYVLPNWLLVFTREERSGLFEVFFTSPQVPAVDAFLAMAAQAINELTPHASAPTGQSGAARVSTPMNVVAQPVPLGVDIREPDNARTDEREFIAEAVSGLLASFITDGGITRLFLQSAHEGPKAVGQESLWARVISVLCSLPERISNLYGGTSSQVPHILREKNYIRALMTQALEALSKESRADLLSLLGQLLGKLSLGGKAEWAVDVFMPFLLHHVADRAWRTCFAELIRHIPQNALENFIHALLLKLALNKQFPADLVSLTKRALPEQQPAPRLYQVRSQVLLELFGSLVQNPSDSTNGSSTRSGGNHQNTATFLFLHKLLLVKVYNPVVLRTVIDFIARIESTRTDNGKGKDKLDDDIKSGGDSSEDTKRLLLHVLVKVVRVWGEKGFIRHSSYEQHKYLFRAVIYGLEYVSDKEELTQTDGLLAALVQGVQNYIAYPVGRTRRFGMIVAERFSRILDPDSERPLSFEYDPLSDDDTEDNGQSSIVEDKELDSSQPSDGLGVNVSANEPYKERKRKYKRKTNDDPDALYLGQEEEEQSDDDGSIDVAPSDEDSDELEAYDLEDDDNDRSSAKVPVYLRDVLSGLRAKDDVDRLESAMKAAERLIRSDLRGDLHDVAPDLMRTLLHLHNQYELEQFGEMRLRAMIALLAAEGETARLVQYLTDQFYAQNYSIQQRVDMLVVMAEAAKELSDSSLAPMFPSSLAEPKPSAAVQQEPQPVREVKEVSLVGGLSPSRFSSLYITGSRSGLIHMDDANEERLPYLPGEGLQESPTLQAITNQPRMIGKVIRKAASKRDTSFAQSGRTNRFIAVHGLFFYPLMRHYDSSDNTFNLLGEDSIVLSKLLHSLAVFIECMGSAAPPAALFRMVRSLVDFVWTVRYHREANVRRAALLAATRTIAITPVGLLISDFLEDFNEIQAWLASVYSEDPDEHCRSLAAVGLLDLRKVAESVTRQQLDNPTNLLGGLS